MPEEDLLNETNIYRCSFKKATAVFSKHALYAAYIIDGIAVAWVVWFAIMSIFIPFVLPTLMGLADLVMSTALAIPWYWYVLGGIPAAYFGYGFAWCVARDLTEGDWNSKTANDGALASFLLLLSMFTIVSGILPYNYAISIRGDFTDAAIGGILGGVFGIMAVLGISYMWVSSFDSDMRVLKFAGAVWHHYHRCTTSHTPKSEE